MKGQATAVVQMLLGLFSTGLIIALIMLFLSKFLDIHTIVYSNEVERHAINSANVLLSSKETAISDNYRTYRAIFSKSKLDDLLISRKKYESYDPTGLVQALVVLSDTIDSLIKEGTIKEMAYPNSIVFGIIADLEDPNKQNAWIIVSRGSVMPLEFNAFQTYECLFKEQNIDWDMVFRLPLGSPVRWPSLVKCGVNFASKTGVSVRGFPVAIRISKDEIHAGRMYIWLLEM